MKQLSLFLLCVAAGSLVGVMPPGIATRLVLRHYAERNRRGLIGTKRRKLRKRAVVRWPVRTVAKRNGSVQTGRSRISDERRGAGNEVRMDAGHSRQN